MKFESEKHRLDIRLLVPVGSTELDALETKYNKRLLAKSRETTCVLHPWIASRPPSRQDLLRLFQRFCDKKTCFVFYDFIYG